MTFICLFLPQGWRCNRWQTTGNLKQWKEYSIEHLWLYLPQLFIYLYIKVNQNKWLLHLFIRVRSNITTITYKSCTKIRTMASYCLHFLFFCDVSFLLSGFSFLFLEKNAFSTWYFPIVFLTRNNEFNCFNWISLWMLNWFMCMFYISI